MVLGRHEFNSLFHVQHGARPGLSFAAGKLGDSVNLVVGLLGRRWEHVQSSVIALLPVALCDTGPQCCVESSCFENRSLTEHYIPEEENKKQKAYFMQTVGRGRSQVLRPLIPTLEICDSLWKFHTHGKTCTWVFFLFISLTWNKYNYSYSCNLHLFFNEHRCHYLNSSFS